MDALLSQILANKIPLESVIKWLNNPKDVPEEMRSMEVCSNTDFALYFLSFLREQTSSILSSKSSITPTRTPEREIQPIVTPKENIRKSVERKNNTPKTSTPSPNQMRHSPIHQENGEINKNKNYKQSNQSKASPSNITLGNFVITSKISQKQKKLNRIHGVEQQNLNVASSNDFPELGTPKRRINPTRIALKSEEVTKSEASNPFANAEEINHSDLVSDRQLLKRECLKLKVDNHEREINLNPMLNKVTNQDKLNILSQLYSNILNNNLAINIMNELYFLIELLTLENTIVEYNDNILGNINNCIYFASVTLQLQKELFKLLDSTTIKFLTENLRLLEFTPELVEYLKTIKIPIKRSLSIMGNSNGVKYPTDSDDKQNFSSTQIFQIFRKHRDVFYQILEKWDIERHFTNVLVKNVESIFKSDQEPEFFVHFAQLFVSQMIVSCIGEGKASDKSQLLELQVDPQRLRRLHERLVTPAKTSGGPCPVPEFSGWEEFFRDFVMIAGNCQFQQHLQDAFIKRLFELNSQQFVASELEDSETSVEDETKNKFLACALSSQLLAKFLGYLHFLPYRASSLATKKLSEHTITLQASLRNDVNPIVNTYNILSTADNQCRLVLTVPWLCSYLTQLDPVSLKLEVYQRTLMLMINILHGLARRGNLSQHASFLLRLNLGWGLGVLVEVSSGIWEIARSELSCAHDTNGITSNSTSLDNLELVDSRTLFSLCPYLSELRGRLAGSSSSVRGSCSGPRHITPIATSTLDPAHQLELQLESNFLQTQPGSVKRSLEFVSERVASLCTKHLPVTIVTQMNQKLNAEINEKVVHFVASVEQTVGFNELVSLIKNGLTAWSNSQSELHIRRLHDSCMTEARQFCEIRCSSTLVHLLPQSCTQIQVQACIKIAARNACTKVQAWISVHLTVDEAQKQILDEIERCARSTLKPETSTKNDPRFSNTLPAGGRDVEHHQHVLCPADVLYHLRELLLYLHSGGQMPDVSHIMTLLTGCETAISNRGDLIPSAQTSIQALSVDLAIALACHQPDLVDKILISRFVNLWQGVMERPQSLDRLLCARNLYQINSSLNPRKTWRAVRELLAALIRSKLVTPASIEEQAVAVLQQEWSQDFLRHYTSCIEDLVREVGREITSSESASFTQLLEWLADFCCDLDDMM